MAQNSIFVNERNGNFYRPHNAKRQRRFLDRNIWRIESLQRRLQPNDGHIDPLRPSWCLRGSTRRHPRHICACEMTVRQASSPRDVTFAHRWVGGDPLPIIRTKLGRQWYPPHHQQRTGPTLLTTPYTLRLIPRERLSSRAPPHSVSCPRRARAPARAQRAQFPRHSKKSRKVTNDRYAKAVFLGRFQ